MLVWWWYLQDCCVHQEPVQANPRPNEPIGGITNDFANNTVII
jgi:hypothetical protein